MSLSNHMMQRLNVAREDPGIRQTISNNSMRSQQQAMAEAQMMRAAILAKTLAARAGAGNAAAGAAAGAGGPMGGPPSAAGAQMNGSAAGASGAHRAPSAYPTPGSFSPPSNAADAPRPFMRQPAAAAAPTPSAVPPMPLLPFVYRRAAQDVQITDPVAGDLMQLDRGTWVLTAAAANATKNTLLIYTTDEDTGAVVSYEVPLPDGRIASLFDMHTLNPLDTVTISGTEVQK